MADHLKEAWSRAVAVHSAGILEALKKVYGMGGLVRDLTGKAVKAGARP
jgi:hypothetical protein